MPKPNIDEIVDYRAEFTAIVKGYKISGDQLTGLCPFHDDSDASFSADLKTGKWKCFTENEAGNYVTFYAKLHGIDNKQAYREILDRYGIKNEKKKQKKYVPYTLEQYAKDKQIPIEFLKDQFKLSTQTDDRGAQYLEEPYFLPDGGCRHRRKRYAFNMLWGVGMKHPPMYGVWTIEAIRKRGMVLLVEGESDTQTLWYLGFPALGVAGASNFRNDQARQLDGLDVYLHVEPDGGGDTFCQKVCETMANAGFTGRLMLWSCCDAGEKDPSDLYLRYGKDEAKEKIAAFLKQTTPTDVPAEAKGGTLTDPPVPLRIPDRWHMSDRGITFDDPKEGNVLICRTPITITRRLRSLEDGTEKVEISYLRDKEWHDARYPRSVIFQAKNVTVLSDLGCTVTSENAKKVVKFLGDLEARNLDAIPVVNSTASFGWQPGGKFIPGYQDNIELDIDPSQQGMASAYCTCGTLEGWVETMRPHRERDWFRFILAAGFAAPLLRIVRQRIFFVYNWGGSKGGKTAALKAALSAWGDPERLMVNFNATQVGLERMASLYSDLPLGIDERQLAGKNQGSLEKIVYMIASGTGRIRGAKTGGIQAVQQWRTVALATGEEPIATESSQTGVSTRVLELYGPPFGSETEAAEMHRMVSLNYGHAGPEFIRKLVKIPEDRVREIYETVQSGIQEQSDTVYGSHLAGVATVALADLLIGQWFFGESEEDAMSGAIKAAGEILSTQDDGILDVNENATNLIMDWIQSNIAFFEGGWTREELRYRQNYGFIENGTAYAYQSLVDDLLKDHGFSPRKTYRYMVDKGMLEQEGSQKRFTVRKLINGERKRFLGIRLSEPGEQPPEPVEVPEDGELPF